MIVYEAPTTIPVPSLFSKTWQADEEAYLEALSEYAKTQGEAHPLAGEVIHVPYADGSAVYVVGKFGGKVGLIHAEIGDAWRDDRFERLATVAELKRMVEAHQRLAAAFARAAVPA